MVDKGRHWTLTFSLAKMAQSKHSYEEKASAMTMIHVIDVLKFLTLFHAKNA